MYICMYMYVCIYVCMYVCTLGKSSNYTGCSFVHDAVRLFNTDQNNKEIDATSTYAYLNLILVEMSPAGTSLRQVSYG